MAPPWSGIVKSEAGVLGVTTPVCWGPRAAHIPSEPREACGPSGRLVMAGDTATSAVSLGFFSYDLEPSVPALT